MKRAGLLDSTKIFQKAQFAWNIYREAISVDQKLYAVCLGLHVVTYSLVASVFVVIVGVATAVIAGALNNQLWQMLPDILKLLPDLFRDASKLFERSPPAPSQIFE